MSEEQMESNEEQVDESVDDAADPVETKARELGWKPKDEFEGDPSQWRSAEVFVDKQPLFEKIQQQNKQLTKAQQAIAELQRHNAKVEQSGYDRAIKELRAERRAAARDDDYDRVDEIEEQIESMREEKAKLVVDQHQPQQDPQEFLDWKANNGWYDSNQDMKSTADVLGLKYADLGLPAAQVFDKVTADIKKLYPDQFRNPNRDMPSGVAGGSTAPKGAKGKLSAVEKGMTEQERTVMNKLVKSGALTKAKYLEDLQKIKGVE